MYEIKVVWAEGAEDYKIYNFDNQKEATAFQHGITEMESKVPGCPKVPQIIINKWGDDKTTSRKGLFVVFHALFMGLWTVLWWHLYVQNLVWVEYLLVGLLSTLGFLLIYLGHSIIKTFAAK